MKKLFFVIGLVDEMFVINILNSRIFLFVAFRNLAFLKKSVMVVDLLYSMGIGKK